MKISESMELGAKKALAEQNREFRLRTFPFVMQLVQHCGMSFERAVENVEKYIDKDNVPDNGKE